MCIITTIISRHFEVDAEITVAEITSANVAGAEVVISTTAVETTSAEAVEAFREAGTETIGRVVATLGETLVEVVSDNYLKISLVLYIYTSLTTMILFL